MRSKQMKPTDLNDVKSRIERLTRSTCSGCSKVSDLIPQLRTKRSIPSSGLWNWLGLCSACSERRSRKTIGRVPSQRFFEFVSHAKKLESQFKISSSYYRSNGWKKTFNRIMQRDRGTCQGCLLKPAVQVHHLTYNNFKNEFDFELVAICRDCHALLHGHIESEGAKKSRTIEFVVTFSSETKTMSLPRGNSPYDKIEHEFWNRSDNQEKVNYSDLAELFTCGCTKRETRFKQQDNEMVYFEQCLGCGSLHNGRYSSDSEKAEADSVDEKLYHVYTQQVANYWSKKKRLGMLSDPDSWPCKCDEIDICTIENKGKKRIVAQCKNCGGWVESKDANLFASKQAPDASLAVIYRNHLMERDVLNINMRHFKKCRRRFFNEVRKACPDLVFSMGHFRHSESLGKSAKFSSLKKRLMQSCDGLCSNCFSKSATQIRSLSNEHLCFETQPLCKECSQMFDFELGLKLLRKSIRLVNKHYAPKLLSITNALS